MNTTINAVREVNSKSSSLPQSFGKYELEDAKLRLCIEQKFNGLNSEIEKIKQNKPITNVEKDLDDVRKEIKQLGLEIGMECRKVILFAIC